MSTNTHWSVVTITTCSSVRAQVYRVRLYSAQSFHSDHTQQTRSPTGTTISPIIETHFLYILYCILSCKHIVHIIFSCLTHRKMTLSLAGRSQKTNKVRVLPTVGLDPEKNRGEMMRKEEEKLRAFVRRDNKQRRIKDRARGMNAGERMSFNHFNLIHLILHKKYEIPFGICWNT